MKCCNTGTSTAGSIAEFSIRLKIQVDLFTGSFHFSLRNCLCTKVAVTKGHAGFPADVAKSLFNKDFLVT